MCGDQLDARMDGHVSLAFVDILPRICHNQFFFGWGFSGFLVSRHLARWLPNELLLSSWSVGRDVSAIISVSASCLRAGGYPKCGPHCFRDAPFGPVVFIILTIPCKHALRKPPRMAVTGLQEEENPSKTWSPALLFHFPFH